MLSRYVVNVPEAGAAGLEVRGWSDRDDDRAD
jgi:hypothetical protein